MKLRMGTRGSALALAQSGAFAKMLCSKVPGLEIETVKIKTSGDRFQTATPKQVAELMGGTKGLFVKEIEEALAEGRIDFAVHSAKDLPADLAPGMVLATVPKREDPRDAYFGRDGSLMADLGPGKRVGTSSLRRQIQLKMARPGVETVPLRGNVDTRLRKLEEGLFDGLILAQAGVNRLGTVTASHESIPVDIILPAPGQGALGIETREKCVKVRETLSVLNHNKTYDEVLIERAFLKAMGGGCSMPLGALASAGESGFEAAVFYSKEDGSGVVRLSGKCGLKDDLAAFGDDLAARVKKGS